MMEFRDYLAVIGVFSSLITAFVFYVSFLIKMQKDIDFLKKFYEKSEPLLDLVQRLEERINFLIEEIRKK